MNALSIVVIIPLSSTPVVFLLGIQVMVRFGSNDSLMISVSTFKDLNGEISTYSYILWMQVSSVNLYELYIDYKL